MNSGSRTSLNKANMGDKKKKVVTMASLHSRGQKTVERSNINKSTIPVNAQYKPIVKRLGGKSIIVTPLSDIKPIIIVIPKTSYPVSSKMEIIAKLLKKIPIKDIRRIGSDILDD